MVYGHGHYGSDLQLVRIEYRLHIKQHTFRWVFHDSGNKSVSMPKIWTKTLEKLLAIYVKNKKRCKDLQKSLIIISYLPKNV